ncbi:MAG: ECF transporter S component [Alistipes sp.]|nr:ECF transporter S component [Alistipes sp.]
MKTSSIKLYSLNYLDAKTYLFAALFIAGNIVLPQICHMIPRGGLILLPIYFFTLIGAYKYGWRVGLLTAILSPLANNLLFAMPADAMVMPILIKSTILALAAGFVASRTGKVTLSTLAAVVLMYQGVGTIAEWIMSGSFAVAMQDFRLGIPGMALQIFGGYLFIKYLLKR